MHHYSADWVGHTGGARAEPSSRALETSQWSPVTESAPRHGLKLPKYQRGLP